MKARIAALCLLTAFVTASGIALADDDYGAIAYSKETQRYGYTTHQRSRERAEDRAIELCDRDDCEVKVWFRDTCAALATGSHGQVTGWAYNESLRRAKDRAVEECIAHDGHRCQVIISACSR